MSVCPAEFYDPVAIRNSLQSRDVITKMTINDVERFLRAIGVQKIKISGDQLICPTICHNPIDEAESMKLYYYDNSKSFHCFTECNENFNIISLYMKYMEINHQKISYDEALDFIKNFVVLGAKPYVPEEPVVYDPKPRPQDFIELKEYDKKALDFFVPFCHPVWLREGILPSSFKRFNIRFSYGENRIIIPHFDIAGRLVGIRMRALDEEDIKMGKYRPAQIGDKMYNHQLGFNLYGIYEHSNAIRKTKRAIIVEGEKSVLLDDGYFGNCSVAVATCGSQLNRFQINLLVKKLGATEIILAYDKEYDNPFSPEGKAYRERLIQKCERYRGLANFYYIFDEHGLLNRKDAPCDKGKEVYEELLRRKIKI